MVESAVTRSVASLARVNITHLILNLYKLEVHLTIKAKMLKNTFLFSTYILLIILALILHIHNITCRSVFFLPELNI